MLKKEDVVTSF